MALEIPTRKCAAALRRDIPPLTASTTRSRRSVERGSAIPPASSAGKKDESDFSRFVNPQRFYRLENRSSRLLKNSLRLGKKVGRGQIFRFGRVHPEKWASALGHFRFLFTPLDTLRPSKPRAWAGELDCRRRRRRRTRRGPCRCRAPSVARARLLSCSSRSIPRCVCAASG